METKRVYTAEQKAKKSAYAKTYNEQNREKVQARKKSYHERNRGKISEYNARRRYGLTTEERTEMLEKQSGMCPICGCDLRTLSSNKVHVDHCHATGDVRGLLCNGCNWGLGHFIDDPVRIRRAATYIEEHARG
jgi:DNA repair exonuclease SbcCD ATPase subunit